MSADHAPLAERARAGRSCGGRGSTISGADRRQGRSRSRAPESPCQSGGAQGNVHPRRTRREAGVPEPPERLDRPDSISDRPAPASSMRDSQ
eukprot:2390971-Pyramimonas_sp.AAC.1